MFFFKVKTLLNNAFKNTKMMKENLIALPEEI